MKNTLNWFESNIIANNSINVVYASDDALFFMNVMVFMLEIIF